MILLFLSLFILDNICRAVTTTSANYFICGITPFVLHLPFTHKGVGVQEHCHLVIGLLYRLNGQSSVFVTELHLYYVFELLPMLVLGISGYQQHNS